MIAKNSTTATCFEVFLFFILQGCSATGHLAASSTSAFSPSSSAPPSSSLAKQRWAPSQELDWASIVAQMPSPTTIKIYPGHAQKIQIIVPAEIASVQRKLVCGNKKKGREVFHQISGNILKAFVSASYKSPKAYSCWLKLTHLKKRSSHRLFDLVLEKFSFKYEKLNVPKKHVELSPKNLARWRKEMAIQKKVYASGVFNPYFQEDFMRPLDSVITSPYGLKRIFNNQRESWHSGTDFRAAVGVPIPVSNRGKAVFVGDLFFNGKTVIVDHGMNIFTMYCHLSETRAEQGEILSKGQILGLAGATGRVTGPHLHWGVKVNYQWISGLPFVEEGI